MSSENLSSMLSNLNFVSDDKNTSTHDNVDYEDDVISIGCEHDIMFEYEDINNNNYDTNDSDGCTKRNTDNKKNCNNIDDVFKNQNIRIKLNYKKIKDKKDVCIADDCTDECGLHDTVGNLKYEREKELNKENETFDQHEKEKVDINADIIDEDVNNKVYCNPIILDIQMIYHTDDKSIFIKELAFKNLNDNSVYSYEFRHETDLLNHRIIKYNNDNNIYDIFTGLDISNGDVMYSDNAIIEILKNVDLILLKGGNKKRILEELYTRCKIINKVPLIINVDGNTACDKDRIFCKNHNVTLASFSFPFVYRHFQIYLNMLCNNNNPSFVYNVNGTFNDCNTIYVHNILSKDKNINIFGRGRVVCVCKNDHSYGSNADEFGNERCALLNMNILENLWYKSMYKSFRKHIDDFNKLKYLSENVAYKRFNHVNKIVNRHNLNNHDNNNLMYKNNNKYFHYNTFNGHYVSRTKLRGYEQV